MHIDVFAADAFKLTSLSKALIDLPYFPTRLGRLGVFQEEPITTTDATIERVAETLVLIPSAARGAPGHKVVPERRNIRKITATHLPAGVEVMADEVQNLRAFGKESDEETALAWLNRKMGVARRRLDLTKEWQRMGALKGQVIDADGTTVLTDLFSEFGVTQQTMSFVLGTDSTKVLQKVIAYKRMIEDALGGLPYTSIRMECSPEFFDALTGHPAVRDAFAYYNQTLNKSDVRGGFAFGDVVFEEYRGSVGSTRFIEAGAAYPVIEGVPDLYVTHYAPAPYNETVNTMGLPYYAKMEEKPMGKGYDVEIQANPLMLNTRPRAAVKATIA